MPPGMLELDDDAALPCMTIVAAPTIAHSRNHVSKDRLRGGFGRRRPSVGMLFSNDKGMS